MTLRLLLILSAFMFWTCSSDDELMPEQCEIFAHYKWTVNRTNAGELFDVSENPPRRIEDGSLEYFVPTEFILATLSSSRSLPEDFDVHWIDSLYFTEPGKCEMLSAENGWMYDFSYDTTGCDILLTLNDYSIYGAFGEGGEIIELERYSVYRHELKPNGFDTFYFEFNLDSRMGDEFKAAEQVRQMYPNQYDTIYVERIVNRLES